ncbi:hypothetical protein, variant [Saprolegnia diclina VS20]|uniref:ABC transporter domain-containing protein n=1 Tax=Saprolegnia diclina (strain VS20) TaxID=1156394 RepID=T0RRL6_SAPDV|nr:hypothetical protein, variant [Saprolegnia diclina VS20]EQC32777.1 hypothetical protein, variant [Saprolegnia diclina VS20]|eukprot:XP_008613920.1 hypothetical protein, variant [Saprolegnia diclina VS20]
MPTPVVASFVELASDPSSGHALPEDQRRYLRLVDARGWHYSIVCILVLDFVANCLGVAATSTETYADGSLYLRLASSACLLVQAVDLALRTMGLRRKLVASRANLVDAIAFLLLCACLACRFVFADKIQGAAITTDGYVDKWHIFKKYKLQLYEADIALAYCFLVVLRILVKPPARTYSKKLHRSAKPDRVSIASLRGSIRQLPSISAASVEKMETELRILCGADDGYMLPEAFMTFVERAYAFRPNKMTASAFLSHFQQVQLADHAAYGIREVMASTLKHWSNQRWFLLATMLVVCVSAAIVPLLSFYLKLLTDEAFPSYVNKTIVPDWDYSTGMLTGTQKLGVSRKFKNLTRGANNEEVDLKFIAYDSFLTGIIGILAICVPFIAADYAMGFFQSKLISRATKHLQTSLLRVILQQPSSFFHDRSEGDLNNLFQADIARVNAMWQAVFWGEYACIVGPSGCGKSTLLGCLMQFYPISAGTLRLDSYDTQHYSKASLADQTAVVFQDGGVLNGSILDNIAYGRDGATRAMCLEAAKLAECHVFVDGLKDGYDTIIGQHAVVNLSGGQIQRICLARALVRQPSLLLLDEATSALDPETEASIVQTLEKLVRSLHMTIISVTHRIATTQHADAIFVMQNGEIVEQGTYNEVTLRVSSLYKGLGFIRVAALQAQLSVWRARQLAAVADEPVDSVWFACDE